MSSYLENQERYARVNFSEQRPLRDIAPPKGHETLPQTDFSYLFGKLEFFRKQLSNGSDTILKHFYAYSGLGAKNSRKQRKTIDKRPI